MEINKKWQVDKQIVIKYHFYHLARQTPQTDESQNQSKNGLTRRREDTKNLMIQNIKFKPFFVA
jgi:hypothetical protein